MAVQLRHLDGTWGGLTEHGEAELKHGMGGRAPNGSCDSYRRGEPDRTYGVCRKGELRAGLGPLLSVQWLSRSPPPARERPRRRSWRGRRGAVRAWTSPQADIRSRWSGM